MKEETKRNIQEFFTIFMFILTIVAVISIFYLPGKDHSNEFYRNLKCKIVAVQDPVDWQHGKFRGIDKEWLIQSATDTTLYARYEVYNDSMFFNHKINDTISFDYILKNRFFKIVKK